MRLQRARSCWCRVGREDTFILFCHAFIVPIHPSSLTLSLVLWYRRCVICLYNLAVTLCSPFLGSASTFDLSGSHPAIKSSTTFVSSWPHTNPPMFFQSPWPSSFNTRYVGTPQMPMSFASAVNSRSFALISGVLAFVISSLPLYPAVESTSASTPSSETFWFFSQHAESTRLC
jgi:hypothetical protein